MKKYEAEPARLAGRRGRAMLMPEGRIVVAAEPFRFEPIHKQSLQWFIRALEPVTSSRREIEHLAMLAEGTAEQANARVRETLAAYKDPSGHDALAYAAATSAWDILISLGALHAAMILNPGVVSWEEVERLAFEEQLRPVSRRFILEYDHPSFVCEEMLHEVWVAVMSGWGFVLMGGPDGDGVSFSGSSRFGKY